MSGSLVGVQKQSREATVGVSGSVPLFPMLAFLGTSLPQQVPPGILLSPATQDYFGRALALRAVQGESIG